MVHFDDLTEEHQSTANQVEAMFPCRERDDCRLKFLDIFIVLEKQSEHHDDSHPLIIRVSILLAGRPAPSFSILDSTIDIISRTGDFAVRGDLPIAYNGPGRMSNFEKTSKCGPWRGIASDLLLCEPE